MPKSRPERNVGAVVLFLLILALSVCSFSTWWYMNYRVGGGRPAVVVPQITEDAIALLNLNYETRFLKKYTIYGARMETLRTVVQNDARNAEGECQTVSTHWLFSDTKATKCIFKFNTWSDFGDDSERNAAKANVKVWCDQRCADVKALRSTTCQTVAYDISGSAGGISGTVSGDMGGGLAEAEFDEEMLCGGTGAGSLVMMSVAMFCAFLGVIFTCCAPRSRIPILGCASLCFLLFLCTAILYGVKATAFLGTTFHENEGFATDMHDHAKVGLDVGYALLILLNILAAALLALLLKPRPSSNNDTSLYEAVVSQPPLAPESIEEAVFQLPPKETPREMTPPQEHGAPVYVPNDAPVMAAAPAPMSAPQSSIMAPVATYEVTTYVTNPYPSPRVQNTYPVMRGAR